MKYILIACVLFTSTNLTAQKKEKIKGSKIVTVTIKELQNFKNIEVNDNLEVFLVKNEKPSIEIEADDNLHDAIAFEVTGNTLKVIATKEVSGAKKFAVRINYTNDLRTISARNESKINALAELALDSISINNFDKSKSYLNVKSTHFSINLSDKSEAELNIKADVSHIEANKDADLKALINSPESKINLYQKAIAEIEGDTEKSKIRLDNNANLIAKKYTVKNLSITTESYSKCSVTATKEVQMAASGKSEIELYGEPVKLELTKFSQSAILYKKEQI